MAECPKFKELAPERCGQGINQPFKTFYFYPDNPEEMNNKSAIVKGTAKTPEGVTVGRAEYDIKTKVLTVQATIKQIKYD